MAKYYNAETLLEFVKQNTPNFNGETTMQCVERAIKEAPTADVEEVKHGRWIKNQYISQVLKIPVKKEFVFTCSLCGHDTLGKSKYCRECGAKMDGRTPQKLNHNSLCETETYKVGE